MASLTTVSLSGLPAGLHARALRRDDAQAVCEVAREAEEHDLGAAMVDLEDILGDWQRPSFDLSTDSVGVFDRDGLIGFAEVSRGGRAEVEVHPGHRGGGIGTQLVAWCEQRARVLEAQRTGQTVPASNQGVIGLLQRRGYEQLWTSWVLTLAPEDEIAGDATPWPGLSLRPYLPGEERAVYRVIEDAFNEWPDRDASTFEDWNAAVLERPGFEAWHLLVAEEAADILGACFLVLSENTVWVDQLAVRNDRRGQGLARMLLVEALRSGRSRGASTARLSTDSRTGALGLYEHVGMRVTETFVHLALDLSGPPHQPG